ncbi:MAG TPA: hypothetical protein VFX96_11210 [Pyrinomonadaceae bacterium]|nr:hypothetical protein [Pyrinomonadaceae bacterium]
MSLGQKAPFPFLALGVAFIVIGITTQRAFLYVGLVFLAVAVAMLVRGRRG